MSYSTSPPPPPPPWAPPELPPDPGRGATKSKAKRWAALAVGGAVVIVALLAAGLWAWNSFTGSKDSSAAPVAAATPSSSTATAVGPAPTENTHVLVTATAVEPASDAASQKATNAAPTMAVSRKYCGSGTVQAVAHTESFTISICRDGDSLIYHGKNDVDGTHIELPATVTADGYSAFNSKDPTHYEISPDGLRVWTDKDGELLNAPVTSYTKDPQS